MNLIVNKITFCKLVPLKDCKGPILELTDEEKEKISEIQKKITECELALYNLDKYYANRKSTTKKVNLYNSKIDYINGLINTFKNEIRQIKINRINIQRANFNKLI